MSAEKFLTGIIHEQNEALRLAVETIDRLNAENQRLRGLKNTAREIKALMILEGISAAEIGRGIGVSRWAIIGVINGRWRSERVEAAIARSLKLPLAKLFPPTQRRAA